jgi:hypothetical protein
VFSELPTLTDFHNFLMPRLKDSTVRCALCGKVFQRLNSSHLKAHEDFLLTKRCMKQVRLTVSVDDEWPATPNKNTSSWIERPETLFETYTRLFGPTRLLDALVAQTWRLYAPNQEEWTLMEHLPLKAEWTTITPESVGWDWHTNRLTKDKLKEHFQCRHTIGIKSLRGGRTKVIVLDVDGAAYPGESESMAEGRAKQTTRALVRLLQRHKLHPHVVASGGKGYHVVLYFDSFIRNTLARNLYEYLVNHPDVPMDGVNVELLPIRRAVKLPLGLHWSSKRFCTYVDPLTLMPVQDPYEYYLRIRPMNSGLLDNLIPEKAAQKPHARKQRLDESWSHDATEMAFKVGIQAPGTRHNVTIRAAAYLLHHMKPETYDEFLELLVQWSQKQYRENGHLIRTPWFAHLRDMYKIAEYVWKHPFTGGLNMSVDFTTTDVHWIRSQTKELAAQRLLLAALYQYRVVGGPFYFGFHRMLELTGMARKSLTGAVKELRDQRRILVVVSKYSHPASRLAKSKTMKYTLAELPETSIMDRVLVTVTPDTWHQDLWFWMLLRVFTAGELKKMYPFAYHRILQLADDNSIVVNK